MQYNDQQQEFNLAGRTIGDKKHFLSGKYFKIASRAIKIEMIHRY